MERSKEIDSDLNFSKEILNQEKFPIDKTVLEEYDQNNKKFSIVKLLWEENDQQKQNFIGFNSVYQYENEQIQLEYLIANNTWKIISSKQNFEEKVKLNYLLENINQIKNLSIEQQIQLIINQFNFYFNGFKTNQNEDSIRKEEKNFYEFSLTSQLSPPSTIIELDEEQTDLPDIALFIDTNKHLNTYPPPPSSSSTSHRIRHDSGCSSTNSLKYTEFIPPSTASTCRRRVIQSIFVRVERKKKPFEKLLNQLKQKTNEENIYELGLEFLRLYDGKFNYPQGYTFLMTFKNRTWFLTIHNIKCVECELGESEPRSILILQYKNKFTTVQV